MVVEYNVDTASGYLITQVNHRPHALVLSFIDFAAIIISSTIRHC